MMKSILIDAGPIIALFDRDDRYHVRMLGFIKGKNYRFVTTTAVITEAMHMLDFNVNAQIDLLKWIINGGVTLHCITSPDIVRVRELTEKYRDRPMDFADATLVTAAERTGIREIVSVDSDFDIYRLPGEEHIQNVFMR